MRIGAYLKILRLPNAAMAAGSVYLGTWISESPLTIKAITALAATALLSTGFGNVINDLFDIQTDRVAHPDRPLPRGLISIPAAGTYAGILASGALYASFSVAAIYGYATLFPLLLLLGYALFLKRTPLAGNIVVSCLVAYALLFGSLTAPGFIRLLIPALFAFLLNISREIIKDLEDEKGDRTAGMITSAVLSRVVIKRLLLLFSCLYLLLLFAPTLTGICSSVYAVIAAIVVLPLHLFRLLLIIRNQWTKRLSLLSGLIKVEMLAGFSALSIDFLVSQ